MAVSTGRESVRTCVDVVVVHLEHLQRVDRHALSVHVVVSGEVLDLDDLAGH